MSVTRSVTQISRVAIYDDRPDDRETLAETLEDTGYEPVRLDEPFNSVEQCTNELARYDAAIVDHRLSPGNFGAYTGAEVVKRLYLTGHPALLVSCWSQGDPQDIQPYRRQLACILEKGEYEAPDIIAGFRQCIAEFEGIFIPQRRATRTIVRIAFDFDPNSSKKRVGVFVPAWHPQEGVTFALDIIPENLRGNLREGTRFFADVNTGANSQDELFFENIELAPEVSGDAARFLRR